MRRYPFEALPLPYSPEALAPALLRGQLEAHYRQHYQAYINRLNQALAPLPAFHSWELERILCNSAAFPAPSRRTVADAAGGVYAHELYFRGLAPPGFSAPVGSLVGMVAGKYGSLERFWEKLVQAGLQVVGSGWVWLIADRSGHGGCALRISVTANLGVPLPCWLRPVLAVDVWEHAYYLQYQSRRRDYLQALRPCIDWQQAEKRFLPAGVRVGGR